MGKYYCDELERGIQLLYFQSEESKFPEGVRLVEQAVQAGEPDAFYVLARCCAWEDGGAKEDMKRAKSLSRDGILKGSNLCVLGAQRFRGLNGDVKAAMTGTLEEAFHEVLGQAESGNPLAQYAVGLFYGWQDISELQHPAGREEYDRNEADNAKEAMKWYEKAARQGFIPAFRNYYICLSNGKNGVKKDVKAAMHFVEELKDTVDIPVVLYWDFSVDYEDLNRPKDRLRWQQAGAKRGCGQCANAVGLAYLNGENVKEDPKEARTYFERAAELGYAYGIYNLGRCYYFGWGVKEDNGQAFAYFTQAAERKIAAAQYLLAECYYLGYGTEQDYDQCFNWASEAAENGNDSAVYYLGRCYLYGQGVEQDTDAAREYLEDRDDAGSLYLMGQMYDKGMGVPADVEQAVSYYQRAVGEGSEEAEEALAHFKKSLMGKWKRR